MKFLKLVIIFILFNTTSFADKNMKIGSKEKLSEVDRVIKGISVNVIFKLTSLLLLPHKSDAVYLIIACAELVGSVA